jgi:hypothetical protein
MWIAVAVIAQTVTCLIALGVLWKDWHELSKRHRLLPSILLLSTLVLTVLSIALVIKGFRDTDRQEAVHKGEAQQFQLTLGTLLDRIGVLQKQVNTEPLMQQNKQLQQDLAETKKIVQATKDQVGKPVPKAKLEAMFAVTPEDLEKKKKETTAVQKPDGSIEFTVVVSNTSVTRAGKDSIYLRLCKGCTFLAEPERFRKITGADDFDREMTLEGVDAGISVSIPLKVTAPPIFRKFEVDVTSRCENCEFRPKDSLFVNF